MAADSIFIMGIRGSALYNLYILWVHNADHVLHNINGYKYLNTQITWKRKHIHISLYAELFFTTVNNTACSFSCSYLQTKRK